jgi:hypothetical protein
MFGGATGGKDAFCGIMNPGGGGIIPGGGGIIPTFTQYQINHSNTCNHSTQFKFSEKISSFDEVQLICK